MEIPTVLPITLMIASLHEDVWIWTTWVQNEMDKVEWCFGSSKIHFMSQSYRFLVLPLPLHNQLTFGNPPTWFKLICILPGDLGYYILVQFDSNICCWFMQTLLTVGWENGVILQPSPVTNPSTGMLRVISLPSYLIRRVASFLAKVP